jgi:uncharacterized Zn-binding protein involved in type VI secretion
MPGQIVTVGATLVCPHSAPVSIVSANTRVMLEGQPAATLSDTYTIVGCTFTIGPKPQPCVEVRWLESATRVQVNHAPVILHTSTCVCLSADKIPQGPPRVVMTQIRVKAT